MKLMFRTSAEQSNGRLGPIAMRSPRSAAAEAYRTLRTSLQFSSLDRALRTILVTSPGLGEGKTTVVANLGVAVAESGKKVVLLDCDLRRPGLHTLFGLNQSPGLSNALIEDASELPIKTTAVTGLAVLSAGESPPNPAEFIASGRLARLLERLRDLADLTLIDSPPTGVVSDAAVLASVVDGVILVVSAGRTRRDEAQQAHQHLATAGARVLGAVLNNARLEKNQRDYYSH